MGLLRAFRLALVLAGSCSLYGCMSCSVNQDPQKLQEKTAQTTAALKSDARAVAAGVREGWSRNKPLDLNRATREQLESLPGITPARAQAIIAHRPYRAPDELVSRDILSRREFDRIADRVTAAP
jgi:DNA uptake protein ComE-like DNA-binding protein